MNIDAFSAFTFFNSFAVSIDYTAQKSGLQNTPRRFRNLSFVFFALIEKSEIQPRAAMRKMRSQLGNAIRDVQTGKAEYHCLPDLPEAGKVKPFLARIAHDLLQIQIEGLSPVGFSGICQTILGRKEGMTGKAEGGVMDTQGLKVLPGG